MNNSPFLIILPAPNMEAASVRKIKGCIATVKTFSGRPTTRMSLLLSWHPTLADVTQKGVLKLMNLDGLTVYNTNDHVQVHELENFLRFVHTFRYRCLVFSLRFLYILSGRATHIFIRKWWRWPYLKWRFRFVFQVKIRKPTTFLLCFRRNLDLFGQLLQPSVWMSIKTMLWGNASMRVPLFTMWRPRFNRTLIMHANVCDQDQGLTGRYHNTTLKHK